VAVGLCSLTEADWHDLRVEADWRYAKGLDPEHSHRYLSEYFSDGKMNGQYLQDWIKSEPEAQRPDKIIDARAGGAVLAIGSAL
jgi:hypothetical protein